MAFDVSILDCTLRDGGYVNDWRFGHSVITGTYRRLDSAGVDYIEVGFLDDRCAYSVDSSIFPNTEAINKSFQNVEKRHAMPVAMIDYGTCGLDSIGLCDDSFIDGIRVIFKKEYISEALPFCKAIKDKGYKLFIQAISITDYTDLELLQYVEKVNEIDPYAFSIVDTYGLLDVKTLGRYFYLIDNNLKAGINIGFHGHNNFQLAFSNTSKFLSFYAKHGLVADSSVYGMGKSAGNCATELLVNHLNAYYGKSYDTNLILEIIDTDLYAIYRQHYWGYKYNFCISALQRVHPSYVKYLLDKKTLSVSSVNEILSSIPEDKKLRYKETVIDSLYREYQSVSIDDTQALVCLKSQNLPSKRVIVLGPSDTILTHKDEILRFCQQSESVSFSVNFYSADLPVDYVFISNAKRYSKLADVIGHTHIDASLILTSNITPVEAFLPDLIFNYASLQNPNLTNNGNSLFLILELMKRLGVKDVVLAGFDGYGENGENYYERTYDFMTDKDGMNESISKDLSTICHDGLNVTFLTPTRYAVES